MKDENDVTTLTFGLFPNVNLKVCLFTSDSLTPKELTSKLSEINVKDASVSSSETSTASELQDLGDRFALLDATRVVSMDQVSIAANSALIRLKNFQLLQEDEQANTDRPSDNQRPRRGRGVALETIICCGGSTNTQSVLKDFAFAESNSDSTVLYNYLFLGYNCESDEEFLEVAHSIGLKAPSNQAEIDTFFSRFDSMEEKALMKIYKLTSQEIAMDSLEKAVLNRIASKFYV